jgi:tRNA modification GTPase
VPLRLEDAATIVAPATAPGRGGVGILRLSGARALELALPLARGVPTAPTPRHAYWTELVDRAGHGLDQGLFIFFQGPHSFTGEDVVELHVHGSPRLLELLAQQVLADGRGRAARPGEFSERAFLNGRIDLSRAEAIADLVSADSEASVRAAAAQLSGELGRRLEALQAALGRVQVDLEGVLNFPDEAEGADREAQARLCEVLGEAQGLLATFARGRLLRRGATVALFGPVNAGKSTLFNRLLGEERALVDEEPGTTRDVLEGFVEWDGVRVRLLDTAGLREEPGRLEGLGMAKAKEAVRGADLAVLLLPPAAAPADVAGWGALAGPGALLVVRGKADLEGGSGDELAVSGVSGLGVEALRQQVTGRLLGRGTAEAVSVSAERHAQALTRAVEGMARALEALEVSTVEEAAGEVGLAQEALGEITGKSASAQLVEGIFRRFCIGK